VYARLGKWLNIPQVTQVGNRVKFDKKESLEIADIARPKIIYRRKNMYFFAFDGFVMYCDQCESSDFTARIIDAIEFSNYQWQK
jgi:hypothetical protein